MTKKAGKNRRCRKCIVRYRQEQREYPFLRSQTLFCPECGESTEICWGECNWCYNLIYRNHLFCTCCGLGSKIALNELPRVWFYRLKRFFRRKINPSVEVKRRAGINNFPLEVINETF